MLLHSSLKLEFRTYIHTAYLEPRSPSSCKHCHDMIHLLELDLVAQGGTTSLSLLCTPPLNPLYVVPCLSTSLRYIPTVLPRDFILISTRSFGTSSRGLYINAPATSARDFPLQLSFLPLLCSFDVLASSCQAQLWQPIVWLYYHFLTFTDRTYSS